MNELIAELERLYLLDGQGEGLASVTGQATGENSAALSLVGADGRVRTLVVGFARAADWERAAALYLAVQNDLDLPPPAVSVGGHQGFALWFSLADPVPLAQARRFLDGLRLNYLADMPAAHLDLRPDPDASGGAGPVTIDLPPFQHAVSGKWSAFIDPSLGSVFIDEPWLEMAPNNDRQAAILAGGDSIKADDFQKALLHLQSLAAPAPDSRPDRVAAEQPLASEASAQPDPAARGPRSRLNVGSGYSDPQSFLLAVMNDPTASARQRIAAAKALLPFFGRKTGE